MTALEKWKEMAIVENARHLEKNDGRTENYGLGHQNYNGGSHGKSDEKKLEDLDHSIKIVNREIGKFRDKLTRMKRRRDDIIKQSNVKISK